MVCRMIVGVLSASVFFSHLSSALVAREASVSSSSPPLAFATTVYSGFATASGFPNVSRDGGGGGQVNGYNVIVFSDTQTPKNGSTGWSFQSNSYAYLTDTSNPLNVRDFGHGGHPDPLVPWGEGENLNDWLIWPNNPLVTQFGKGSDPEAYAIYEVNKRTSGYPWQYNTLCKITASDTGLTVTRPVQKYTVPNSEHNWSWAVASHNDSKVRVFATGAQSLYIAKVDWSEMEDTKQYTFWNGTGWGKDEASVAPIATGNFGNSTGDVFWSPHLDTWIIVFFKWNAFYSSYSTTRHARGPYTEPQKIFDPPWDNTTLNYAGHAYPQFFGTDAKDVLLSWTAKSWTAKNSNYYTRMAKLTFDP